MSQLNRSSRKARICMPTSRDFTRMAFQCGRYEAQDVLVDADDVDLIHLKARPGFRFRESWQRRLLWRDITQRLAYVNPGLEPVRLTQDYEVFIVVCQTYWDLLYVNAIQNWKDRCRTSIIWIDELWASLVPQYKYWIQSLKRFDHIVLGMQGTVAKLSDAIGRPCHYLPGAVDALRFTPLPVPPKRVVDVYSIGRRWEGIHQVLLKKSATDQIFYIHETLQGGESQVSDPQQHRRMFANVAKRSRYFMVAPGKVNVPEETQGQVEVGFRYFEGCAAGTVMLGQAPRCEPFQQMFDWPDAVIELNTSGADLESTLESLEADPERLAEISRRNSVEALLRHDWIYRWKKLLEIAGVAPAAATIAREKRLAEVASSGIAFARPKAAIAALGRS
jgi:hypothetical protein